MDKKQFLRQMRMVLMIPGVCPKEQREQVLAKLEAMSEEQVTTLIAAIEKLPKDEVMAAMRSGDMARVERLMQEHLGTT